MNRTLALFAVLAVSIGACASSDEGDASGPSTTAGAATTTSVVAAATTESAPLEIVSTSVEANPVTGLGGWVEVVTSTDASVTVTVAADDHEREFVSSDAATDHRIAVIGLRPERDYTVSVDARASGEPAAAEETLSTPALPDDFPVIEVTGEPSSDEWLLFASSRFGSPPLQPLPPGSGPRGYVVALDADGEVVWFHPNDKILSAVSVTDDGNVLVASDPGFLFEVTPTNEVVREWHTRATPDDHDVPPTADVIDLDLDSVHHAVEPLPNGNVMVLSSELHTVAYDAPRCGETPDDWSGTYDVISDRFVEVDLDSGELGLNVDLADLVDPSVREGWAMCGPQAMSAYGDEPVDWSHGNALTIDVDRNLVAGSFRHLDLVAAIRLRDDEDGPAGELLWELGPEGDLEWIGSDTWFSAQHAIQVQPDGTYTLYDNGVSRGVLLGVPVDERPPGSSRALHLDIDAAAATAEVLQSYARTDEDGRPLYAVVVGGVDIEPGGTWLITDGGQLSDLSLRAEIVEVDPAGGPPTYEVDVRGGVDHGFAVFKAERVTPFTG